MEVLKDYLVVYEPDNPVEIARKALIAIENKDEIIDLYKVWVKENDREAKSALINFRK
ncbi:hypothetical protein D3C80_2232020 [compost metagenome]